MTSKILCPQCQTALKVNMQAPGAKLRCPRCLASFRIPAPRAVAVAAPAPPPAAPVASAPPRAARGWLVPAALLGCGGLLLGGALVGVVVMALLFSGGSPQPTQAASARAGDSRPVD